MSSYLKLFRCLLLVLAAYQSAAQSNLSHKISASVGPSFPVGKFSKDSAGEGHGFADPGLSAQVFYNVGRAESRLSYLAGITAIINPLDERSMLALWPPGVRIEAGTYKVYGISGGALLDLAKSARLTWQLKATVGMASITYPSHEMQVLWGDGVYRLLYKADADKSINLNGSLGSLVQCKVSSRFRLGGELDFFRSRSHHVITYTSNTFPSSSEQERSQQISMINIKIAASYSL